MLSFTIYHKHTQVWCLIASFSFRDICYILAHKLSMVSQQSTTTLDNSRFFVSNTSRGSLAYPRLIMCRILIISRNENGRFSHHTYAMYRNITLRAHGRGHRVHWVTGVNVKGLNRNVGNTHLISWHQLTSTCLISWTRSLKTRSLLDGRFYVPCNIMRRS